MKFTKSQLAAIDAAGIEIRIDAETSMRRYCAYNETQDETREIRYQDFIQADARTSGSRSTAASILVALGIDADYARLQCDSFRNEGKESGLRQFNETRG